MFTSITGLSLKHKADRPNVCTWRYKVGSAEGGVEVVKCDFVGEVGNSEPERDVGVIFLGKQIVSTEANVQYVPGGDASRIVIIILGAGRRYSHSCRPKVGFVALCRSELIIGRRHVASTKEADSRLFGGRQAKNSLQGSSASLLARYEKEETTEDNQSRKCR